jgi:hypothetical protein
MIEVRAKNYALTFVAELPEKGYQILGAKG